MFDEGPVLDTGANGDWVVAPGFLGVADVEKGSEAAKEVAGNDFNERIDLIKLDLGSLSSVREAAKEFLSKSSNMITGHVAHHEFWTIDDEEVNRYSVV